MTKIILHGCFGQMGVATQKLAAQTEGFEIVAGIDAKSGKADFPVYAHIGECDASAGVVVDFSIADAVPRLINWCLEKHTPLVLCTTGLSEAVSSQIRLASERIPIFKSANMSLGINFMLSLVERAAEVLSAEGFDIEILEKHHHKKADAPSGTALMLANAMNGGGQYHVVTDRSHRRQARPADEIGISSVRGGSIVGEHCVIFAGRDEVIEISHSAFSKDVYAIGALKAAEFITRQKPGLYDMRSLLNGK